MRDPHNNHVECNTFKTFIKLKILQVSSYEILIIKCKMMIHFYKIQAPNKKRRSEPY